MIYDPERKMYIQEHQMKMENKIGRKLKNDERVHHKNEKRSDNSMKNLQLTTTQEHAKLHGHRWTGKNNPSYNMSKRHKESLKKAWKLRKKKFGETGARNPNRLRKLGKKYGKLTPH